MDALSGTRKEDPREDQDSDFFGALKKTKNKTGKAKTKTTQKKRKVCAPLPSVLLIEESEDDHESVLSEPMDEENEENNEGGNISQMLCIFEDNNSVVYLLVCDCMCQESKIKERCSGQNTVLLVGSKSTQ